MFPYPSGDLHIGHWYAFGLPDSYARFKRMQGLHVLSPFGFDAFGLPAENAAIKRNIHPAKWTLQNIEKMREQMKTMGPMYDWSREIITCQPDYYKWTQWMFLQMFENGLAQKRKTWANWCPADKTVLANEQVVEGKCERCGTEVVQRQIDQWVFKITDYAQRLLDDLDKVDWPERTKTAQRNWIGRSEGALISFKINISDPRFYIKIFTTRPDTIFGATYLVLAPEHDLLKNNGLGITNYEEVQEYIRQAFKKTPLQRQAEQKQKTGVEIKGVKAINPANGKEIPLWVADYVLGEYGTGAIMAVPAHDQRDWDFAHEHKLDWRFVVYPGNRYWIDLNRTTSKNIEIVAEKHKKFGIGIIRNDNDFELFSPDDATAVAPLQELNQNNFKAVSPDGQFFSENEPWLGVGTLKNSGKFNGLFSEGVKKSITDFATGKLIVQYKLRDWIVSRQRYWGAPIPIVECGKCGLVGVPEKELPVLLPELKDFRPADDGRSPLAKVTEFVNTTCPQCKGPAARETDTMDTFVDSSWYFLRYTDSHNDKKFADAKKMQAWLPVDIYIGGAEHTVLHLLYSRFFTKVLYDLKCIQFIEPFTKLRHQGTILGPDSQKMSKSRGNVIAPDPLVKQYGADVVRMFLGFLGPYDQGGPWSPGAINGVARFLEKVYRIITKSVKRKAQNNPPRRTKLKTTERLLNKTIKKVGEDLEQLHFNTAISALMVLVNKLQEEGANKKTDETLVKLLAPFAPHLAEELWAKLGNKTSVHNETFPTFDPALIQEETATIIVQVNGKLRGKLTAPAGLSQEEVVALAKQYTKINEWLSHEIKKTIFVPNKLINFVV